MSNTTDIWNPALIRKYDLSGPRYTSYPTAAQFSDAVGERAWQQAIERSNASGAPLSLYFHIPFCDTVCYYCACNKIITANKKVAAPYIQQLLQELAMQAQYVDCSRPVTQLHWGGGTPTYLSDEEMTLLMAATREHFNLVDDTAGEFSIEIHPGSVDPERIALLRRLGFNRLSMGVQDFNPAVQQAVNRFNSEAQVAELMAAIRANGFSSISLDLIYGLPLQTRASFAETLQKVIALSPDRLSVFNYAHLPHLFKTQKQIDASQLPEPQEKLAILQDTIASLLQAGYRYIGMDHFAKADDELAIAQQRGDLYRNFQGYSTNKACDMLAFGVSAINSIAGTSIQNHKKIDDYSAAIDAGKLPLSRGFVLSDDDAVRQRVINELICNFYLDFAAIERDFNIDFHGYFADALDDLRPMTADGLLSLNDTSIQVHNAGRLLIRRICMAFDAYIERKAPAQGNQYSRII